MGNDSSRCVGVVMVDNEYQRDCSDDSNRISEVYELMPDKKYRFIGDFCNDFDTARSQRETA
jgi:hypothetical protein